MHVPLTILRAAVAVSARTVVPVHCFAALANAAKMAMPAGQELIQVKKLSDNAALPVRGSKHAAGFDLSSAHDLVVPAGKQAIVKTDLSIAIPQNTYARIAPRSGLAVKKMIDVGAGVVDYDYRGPVGVVLFNHGSEDFHVYRGDRVAQLILERISMAEVREVAELSETARGEGGFGSTGVVALGEVAVNTAGAQDIKKMKVDGDAALVQRLLQLVSKITGIVKNTAAKDTLEELRGQALQGTSRLERALQGALDHYQDNQDMEELMLNLKIISQRLS